MECEHLNILFCTWWGAGGGLRCRSRRASDEEVCGVMNIHSRKQNSEKAADAMLNPCEGFRYAAMLDVFPSRYSSASFSSMSLAASKKIAHANSQHAECASGSELVCVSSSGSSAKHTKSAGRKTARLIRTEGRFRTARRHAASARRTHFILGYGKNSGGGWWAVAQQNTEFW